MIIEEVRFKTGSAGREGIRNNYGREVIVKDSTHDWCHGVISPDKDEPNESYYMAIQDSRGMRRLHFHDLARLLVITKYQGD